ncbi:MAG: spermidine synthase, partial [Blastocatellia bacterium]|nr:spermidine synthase [Blastocatellia bacterium]
MLFPTSYGMDNTLGKRPIAIYGIFAISLATSALLLFWVQPLIAKALLPSFGGVPEVWGGCLIFFQTILLAAYGYVIILNRIRKLGLQAFLHIALLAATALLALPLNPGVKQNDWLYNRAPILSVLAELAFKLGLPAFALATTSPLLQTWVARIYPSLGQSVYSLFAVSNAGSLLATLGYPFLVEPALTIKGQAGVWTWMYLVYVLAVTTCAGLAWRLGRTPTSMTDQAGSSPDESASKRDSPNGRRWLLLSAIPTSLLLGVTNYITSTIAPTPLLWLAPLSLYLLAFILAFSSRSRRL